MLTCNRDRCRLKLSNSSYNSPRRHIAPRIIVTADYQQARIVALGFDDQVVQKLKVVVISRDENPLFTYCMSEMHRVGAPGLSNLAGIRTLCPALRSSRASRGSAESSSR
jgi:hypothetical protein